MADDQGVMARLMQGQTNQFPMRMGIDVSGKGITNPLVALLQMIDGHGLTGEQMDRNQAMFGPLYGKALREHPEILDEKIQGRGNFQPQPYGENDRRMLNEDLNSVQIKYNNWRKGQTGQELTPQDRVTQSFVDLRNPNSRW